MKKKTLDDEADAIAAQAALAERLAKDRADAQRREQLAELRRLTTLENHRRDALGVIRDMVALVEPPKLERPKPPKRAPRHTWAPILSDWQLGQYTKRGSTGGMFEQTSAVTKAQVRKFWEVLTHLHEIDRHGKDVDELVIFSLGDLVENDQMRESQAAHVDALVTRQAVDVFDLLSWLLYQATALFPKVRLLHVGGNHDRTTPKGGVAGLGDLGYTDTYSWLLGEMLRRMHERTIDSGRLVIQNEESFFGTAIVAGQRCVYEHGASFRASTGSYGGISYYSIANAAAGYQRMLDGADFVLMGHHHVPMVLPMGNGWQVVNGALPPSSDYAQAKFKSVRRPTQILLDLHEEYGLVGWRPVYLDTPGQVKPGEHWQRVRAA